MSERAAALADRFEQVNKELIATVEGLSDAQWQTGCGGDPRSLGVVAHHVGNSHQSIAGMVQASASGQGGALPAMEQIDGWNAQHAAAHSNCTREETLALLRENGEAAASMVRGLNDEQLDRPAGPLGTTQGAIELVLIGHIQDHLNAIRGAAGA
jgi:hypothetical protein